jgi:pilus assembly protein CpaB
MRACAVKVNDVVGVAGFAVPGMRVDVLVSGSAPGGASNVRAKTLLQNIRVLSAGTNFQRDNEGKPVQVQVVNLLVTPEQAEILSLASNETKIQLVLRNPLDNQMAKPPGIAMASLFGDPPPPLLPAVIRRPSAPPVPVRVDPPVAPRPEMHSIQVLNGGKTSEQILPQSGARDEKR